MADPCPHTSVTCTTTLRVGTTEDGSMVGAPLLTVAGSCTLCGGTLTWPHLATITPLGWQDVATDAAKRELRITTVVEAVEQVSGKRNQDEETEGVAAPPATVD